MSLNETCPLQHHFAELLHIDIYENNSGEERSDVNVVSTMILYDAGIVRQENF